MLCQKCKKRQANAHIHTMINGDEKDIYLCSQCAVEDGYANTLCNIFDMDPMMDMGSMMSSLLDAPMTSALAREEKCPRCGATFSQISKSGKVGCAECYNTFFERLLPTIKRIHGNTVHTGKRLRTARLGSGTDEKDENTQSTQSEIDELTARLAKAIKTQEFEQAAQLRDRINELKAKKGESDNG